MKRLRMLLIAAALMTGGSALATAQPRDHDRRDNGDRDRYSDRGRNDYRGGDRGDRDDRGRYFDRDNRRFFGDRDDRRSFDRDDHSYYVGERRWFNGYYWNWDGQRWCRRDGRAIFYFSF
jgi:Ni/Co efflux regulator RcnB